MSTNSLRPKALFAVVLGMFVACGPEQHERTWPGKGGAVSGLPGTKLGAPLPAFSEGMFPCKECHDPSLPVNTERRQLKLAHEDVVLHHDNRWCYDCHDQQDRDKLHLISGERIDFSESYRLCGECHGDKYRDWVLGVHGKRTGDWNGEKTYLVCANCHAAHAPAFKPLKPSPAPLPPGRLQAGESGAPKPAATQQGGHK